MNIKMLKFILKGMAIAAAGVVMLAVIGIVIGLVSSRFGDGWAMFTLIAFLAISSGGIIGFFRYKDDLLFKDYQRKRE